MKGKLSIVKVLASFKRQYRTSKSRHANQARSQKLTKAKCRRASNDDVRVRVRLKKRENDQERKRRREDHSIDSLSSTVSPFRSSVLSSVFCPGVLAL